MNSNIIFVIGLWLGVMITLGVQWIQQKMSQRDTKTKCKGDLK